MGLILVVSEDAVEIETIKTSLSVHGWWVTVACDRQAALQVAADQAPKLVVVDSGVSEATELIRSFGVSNGGPGVLVCAPLDVEGSLVLREAGADEVLTKPIDGPRLLEALQRCLATPREQHVERAPAHVDLLTSEEIFGDVLRELEQAGAEEAEVPAAVAPRPAVPVPRVAPVEEPLVATADEPVQRTPVPPRVASPAPAAASSESFSAAGGGVADAQPVVSLAGLFDGELMGDLPQASQTPAQPSQTPAQPSQPPADAGAEGLESLWGSEPHRSSGDAPDWQGEERRRTDRPWAPEEAPPVVELPADPPRETLQEPLLDLPLEEPSVEAGLPPEGEEFAVDDSAGAASDGFAGPRLPRQALVLGSIAAALLVVLGVVFLRNPGAGEDAGAAAAEPVEAVTPTGEDFAGESLAEATPPPVADVDPPADDPQAALAAAVESQPAPPDLEQDQMEDLDLEAIVDQELERREEELRQVFLEEEKRLLRELGNLDQEEETEDGEDGDSGQTGGVGRGG